MNVCMYVCMNECVCVYVCVYMYVGFVRPVHCYLQDTWRSEPTTLSAALHLPYCLLSMCVYVCVYMYMYVYVCMDVCMYVCMYREMNIFI
jgi:hypothetical protein